MKQKRKSKNGYRLSNKRLLIVTIGLAVILMLAIANLVYMTSYRTSVAEQTSTSIVATNNRVMDYEMMTETQATILTATTEASEP
jgi:hypothetical protein